MSGRTTAVRSVSLGTMPRASARVTTVAEMLDCEEGQIRRLIDAGEIQAHCLGRRGVRVYLDSVAEYQARSARKTSAAPKTAGDKPPSASRAAHAEAMSQLRSLGVVS